MTKYHPMRILFAILAGALLTTGAVACIFGGEDETAAELERIDGVATANKVDLEVLKTQVKEIAEEGGSGDERLAKLEKENQELKNRIAVLEGVSGAGGAMTGGAASELGAAYDAASPEDRELVRKFLECSMKTSGVEAAQIAAMIPEAEKTTWHDIGNGTTNLEQVKFLAGVICTN